MTDGVDDHNVVDRDLEAPRAQLGSLDDPGVIETVEGVRTAVE